MVGLPIKFLSVKVVPANWGFLLVENISIDLKVLSLARVAVFRPTGAGQQETGPTLRCLPPLP